MEELDGSSRDALLEWIANLASEQAGEPVDVSLPEGRPPKRLVSLNPKSKRLKLRIAARLVGESSAGARKGLYSVKMKGCMLPSYSGD